jgi:hypothetical protein
MVEVDDAASDLPRAAPVADPPALAEVDAGARWHPSSPRVSPLGLCLSRSPMPGHPLVIDCVMGWTTSPQFPSQSSRSTSSRQTSPRALASWPCTTRPHGRVGHAAGLLRRRPCRVRLRPRRLRASLVRQVRALLRARARRPRPRLDRHRLDEPALRRRHRRDGCRRRTSQRSPAPPSSASSRLAPTPHGSTTTAYPGEVRLIRGRLRFGDADASAPFPSALVVLGPNVEQRACEELPAPTHRTAHRMVTHPRPCSPSPLPQPTHPEIRRTVRVPGLHGHHRATSPP